ncbi:MAG: LacI family DNA-binding transcriptional regulator [Bacteroidetes bacterium]|nr:LacI family DNA-binding transcriptional regulator [Bacteroidota bacterium]
MKYNQVTIKDLARELGISPSTVSRALKDHPDISRETKKAVNELAEKLQYEPNIVALNLRSRKTRTIGVIIPEVVHFFFSTVISGIEHEANTSGYSVILTQSAESCEREKSAIKTLYNSRVDGMLIAISRETEDLQHIEQILNRGIPVVFYDRAYPRTNTNLIQVDDYEGARQATLHLAQEGCKRIAHIQAAPKLDISKQRLAGYRDVLHEYRLPDTSDLVYTCEEGSVEAGRKAMEKFLFMKNRPDGIFANNDVLAIGAAQVIKERDLSIPGDVAVVGFSNWMYSQMMDPPLTSVDQPGFEMGKEAARMLIRRIEHGDDPKPLEPETLTLRTKLIVRESSRRKSRK